MNERIKAAERSKNFNDTTGSLRGGNSHPDRCKCQEKETGTYADTPHKHYPEPPYSCGRCKCKAYEPAVATARQCLDTGPVEDVETSIDRLGFVLGLLREKFSEFDLDGNTKIMDEDFSAIMSSFRSLQRQNSGTSRAGGGTPSLGCGKKTRVIRN